MKIKYAIIAAVILAATTITSVKTIKSTAPLFEANVEALAEQETLMIQCANISVMYQCKAYCWHCGKEWISISSAAGPYVLGSTTCTCGHIM